MTMGRAASAFSETVILAPVRAARDDLLVIDPVRPLLAREERLDDVRAFLDHVPKREDRRVAHRGALGVEVNRVDDLVPVLALRDLGEERRVVVGAEAQRSGVGRKEGEEDEGARGDGEGDAGLS